MNVRKSDPSVPKAVKTLEELLALTHRRAPVPFTHRDAERALAALLSTEDLWEAIRWSRAPMRAICAFWEALQERGLLRTTPHGLRLTPEGVAWARELGAGPPPRFYCPACEGRGVDATLLSEELRARFSRVALRRPEAVQAYDQGFVTEQTTWARVLLAWMRGDLAGKSLFVLGDDDLVSLAAALTGAPRRVLAVDIDERLVRFLRETARAEGLSCLEAVQYDLRQPLPESWIGQFDTFFTDPTESLQGLTLTLKRALLALRGTGSAGYFGLTHAESSLSKWAQVQRFLLEHGAVLTELREDFNAYAHWGYMETMRSWAWLPVRVHPKGSWYQSAWYRIELLDPPELSNEPVFGDIFQDEEAATT
ncbi:MAG: bis-aminopropyl spermidine synthase family protein [Bacteroidetes bacterium]|nr:bis-aminopropyl spermidine synthase family protein [Rhodothermia bacterium]MCS7155132.1 bis-aminopropyl spermidine synthase family protein [Bacteroidota bacterium]MCX7907359.1 bis-aminopropyl spermidine synthase family protein [Bacteroidota bacterium]MDW8137914.1 bis-aminopropyl spermidine synthase family protein [Bacteroidota bacterium]MDW8286235.1 bis-aminopropyl spermidine synthase family protein [Bacteroidota bacterium]